MTSQHDFPSFSAEYRQRWHSAGLWNDATLHGGFDETVAANPDKVALISRDARYTFGEFKAESDALAAGLLGAGIGSGDIVAVQLPNWVEFCFLQIALSRIGAVIQPLHMAFREREVRNLCDFCETDVAVVCENFRDYDYAGLMRGIMPDLPNLRAMIVTRGAAQGDNEYVLTDIIAEGRENLARLDEVEVSPDDIFYLNFTSGTEGNPKGFLHTHNTLISRLQGAAVMQMQANPDRVSLACSPMTHSFGHFTTYHCALGGMPIVLVDRYNPTEILELIDRDKVTSISGTPAHLIGILSHKDFETYDTSSIGAVGVGGARSAPELISKLERTWGVKTGNTYGMGENIVHTMTLPTDPEEKIRDTVGRPIPGVELKIVDSKDRTKELAAGELGEIVFRGPTLFVGYHKQPELTAQTRDDEGWFYTSDLGSVDDDGYLTYAGRAKEVINRGGTKIYPKEIEDLLNTHPRVVDAAVVGWPDERMGERVCAYVIPEDGKELSVDEVKDFFNDENVTQYMIPEFVINLSEFPMTPTGKVRKATLQEDAAERSRNVG